MLTFCHAIRGEEAIIDYMDRLPVRLATDKTTAQIVAGTLTLFGFIEVIARKLSA